MTQVLKPLRKKVGSEHHNLQLDESDSQAGSEPEREQACKKKKLYLYTVMEVLQV